ncbi:MAG: hypothetical protein QXK24_00165 [Ignisphaera sp.]
MKIGFDLDGVVADIDLIALELIHSIQDPKLRKRLEEQYYLNRKVLFNPSKCKMNNLDTIYIITSRYSTTGLDINEITKEWLKQHNVYFDILLFVENPIIYLNDLEQWYKELAYRKAEVINKEHLDVFFEDDPKIAKHLREMCPMTKIVKFGDRIG